VRMALTPRLRIVWLLLLLLLTLAGSLCTQSSRSFRIQVCPQDVVGGVGVAIPGDVAVLAHSHPPDRSPRPPVLGLKQLRVTPAAQLAATELVHQVQPHPGMRPQRFYKCLHWATPMARGQTGSVAPAPKCQLRDAWIGSQFPHQLRHAPLFCNVPASYPPQRSRLAPALP
jgi:hypothetical protein